MNKLDLKILNYILLEKDTILHQNIFEFAAGCNVSASKITKTCQKLGLDGYKQLRYTLADIENIQPRNSFVILIKLEELKEEVCNSSIEDINYDYLKDIKMTIHSLLQCIEECDDCNLKSKLDNHLKRLAKYFSCLSSVESKEYYINFWKLLQEELTFNLM